MLKYLGHVTSRILGILVATLLASSGLVAPAQAAVAVPTFVSEVISGNGDNQTVELVGDKLWVTGVNSRKTYVVDRATGVIDHTIDLPAASGYTTKSSVDSNFLWLNHGGSSITRVNLVTREAQVFTGLCTARDIDSDGTFVWLACTTANKVIKVDAATGAKVNELAVSGPETISSDGTAVWVSYSSAQSIGKIDPATNTFVSGLNAISTGVNSMATSGKIWGDYLILTFWTSINVQVRSITDGSLVYSLPTYAGSDAAMTTQTSVVYEGTLWMLSQNAAKGLQYNLFELTNGLPTYEGQFAFGFLSAGSNAVYDGVNLWIADAGGKLGKYTAPHQASIPPSITTDVNQVSRDGEVEYTVSGVDLQYTGEMPLPNVGFFIDEVWFGAFPFGNTEPGSPYNSLPWGFFTQLSNPDCTYGLCPAFSGLQSDTKFTIRYYGPDWDGGPEVYTDNNFLTQSEVTHLAGAGVEWFKAQPASGSDNTTVNIAGFYSAYSVLETNGNSIARFSLAGQPDTDFPVEGVTDGLTGTINVTSLPASGVYTVTIISSESTYGTFTFTYTKPRVASNAAPVPNQFVTFKSNGGSGSDLVVGANSPSPLSANWFKKAGYVFTGWNTQADGTGVSYADGATFDFKSSVTLYAQWSLVKSKKYVSTFAGNKATLTPAMKKTITSWAKKLPSNAKIVCQGSTSGSQVTAFDKKLAKKRAKNVCSYAVTIKKDLTYTITTNPSSASKIAARHVWMIQQ